MTDSEKLIKFNARLQGAECSETLAMELIADAEMQCKSYINRNELPDACIPAMLRLAVSLYNRLGIEGESGHSEGGVSQTVEGMPDDVKTMLRPYRLAGVAR